MQLFECVAVRRWILTVYPRVYDESAVSSHQRAPLCYHNARTATAVCYVAVSAMEPHGARAVHVKLIKINIVILADLS